MTDPADVRDALRDFALGLPGAWEDHPWHESVVKVGKKIFVFLGMEDSDLPSIGMKLRESNLLGLAQVGVTPSGYGLGKAGWVTVDLRTAELPLEALQDWVLESYLAVAPKRLVAEFVRRES